MKKKLSITVIFVWIFAVALLIAVFVIGTLRFGEGGGLIKEERFSALDINSLALISDSVGIEFNVAGLEQIRVCQYGRLNTPIDELFVINSANGSVKIRLKQRFRLFDFNWMIREKLVVELPISWKGGVAVDVKSGGLTIGELYISNHSGGMKLGEVKTSSFDLACDSGGIDIKGMTGTGSVRGVSGGIRIRLSKPLGSVDLSNKSGSMTISVDKSINFSLEGESASGGIDSNFALQKSNDGHTASAVVGSGAEASITARTKSGSVSINHE